MGLLDDAIREHLDLKRRRGADPAEVERAEREALGPVRRNPNSADLPSAEDQPASEDGFAYDQAAEDGWSHDSLQEPVSGAAEAAYDEPAPAEPAYEEHGLAEPAQEEPGLAEPAYEEPGLAEPAYEEPAAAEPIHDEPPAEAGRPPRAFPAASDDDPEPFPTAPPSSRPLTDLGGGETQEYNVEEYLAAEEEGKPASDDDVLEETPEFLQDTPDHDRLWFEQRPPKDFDFDE
ncbi:MAG: hypothetical protein ACXVRX_08095 [Solirubrobacteraceae bacterium]